MKQREVTLFNMALLFVFWLALGILKVCHGNETIASSTPAYSDNSTHAAESTPASSESVTRAAESTPASSESVTRAAESTSASSESVTRAAESTPASSESVTRAAESTPASSESVTRAAESTPASSESVTRAAESTPASSESVTRAAESTPASSESVTRAAESTPASSESVTRAAESTPASSDSTKPVASITPASRNSLTPTISATGISITVTPAVLASLTFIGGVLITLIFGFVVFSYRRHRHRQIHPPKDNENTISLDDASTVSHNQIVAFMRPPLDHHRDTQGPKMSSDMTAEFVNDSKDNDFSVLHPTETSIQGKQYPSNEGNHCEDSTVYNEVGEVREYMSVIDETDVNTVVAATRL